MLRLRRRPSRSSTHPTPEQAYAALVTGRCLYAPVSACSGGPASVGLRNHEEGITLIADATKLAAQGKLKEGIGLPNPPLHYAVEDFLKSVVEGAPVACGAAEGFRAAAVAILMQQAMDSGREIEIAPALLQGA